MRRHWILLATVAALSIVTSAADGQTVETETTASADGSTGLFTVPGARTLERRMWNLVVAYHVFERRNPLAVEVNRSSAARLDYERASFGLSYGLTDTIEIHLMLPYERLAGDRDHSVDANGFGKLRLGISMGLPIEKKSRPERLRLAVQCFLEPDTSAAEISSGDTGFGVGVSMGAGTPKKGDWVVHFGLHSPESPGTTGGALDTVRVEFGYRREVQDGLEWLSELSLTRPARKGLSAAPPSTLDFATGTRWWPRQGRRHWHLDVALRVNLAETKNLGGLVALSRRLLPVKNQVTRRTTLSGGYDSP